MNKETEGGGLAENLSARDDRVDIRVGSPKEEILTVWKTKNYEPIIDEHKIFINNVYDNPLESYKIMRDKLDAQGPNASFQVEFEGVVAYLTKYLFQDKNCVEWLEKQPLVSDQLIAALVGIQLETRFMYPYRTTIYVIQRMLSIIDRYHREKPDQELPPYYHNFRYQYYMTLLTDVRRNDIVMLPTCGNVSATGLIKIRCVPIHLLGVVNTPRYADQYWNSPLDFWAHDLNHARRTMLETDWYYDTQIKHRSYNTQRNYFSLPSKFEFYKEMADFTKNVILPIITINKSWAHRKLIKEKIEVDTVTKYELEEYIDDGYKALMRLLIFEIVHEKAWPITTLSLLRNIV